MLCDYVFGLDSLTLVLYINLTKNLHLHKLFVFLVDNFSQLFSFHTQLDAACCGLIMRADLPDCCWDLQ